jgi:hypothetical protein
VDDSLVIVDAATGESRIIVPGTVMREPRVFRWVTALTLCRTLLLLMYKPRVWITGFIIVGPFSCSCVHKPRVFRWGHRIYHCSTYLLLMYKPRVFRWVTGFNSVGPFSCSCVNLGSSGGSRL